MFFEVGMGCWRSNLGLCICWTNALSPGYIPSNLVIVLSSMKEESKSLGIALRNQWCNKWNFPRRIISSASPSFLCVRVIATITWGPINARWSITHFKYMGPPDLIHITRYWDNYYCPHLTGEWSELERINSPRSHDQWVQVVQNLRLRRIMGRTREAWGKTHRKKVQVQAPWGV